MPTAELLPPHRGSSMDGTGSRERRSRGHDLLLGASFLAICGCVASSTPGQRAARNVAPRQDAPPAAAASTSFADLESAIRAQIDARTIPSAAVAIAKNGVIVYENAFGWADKETSVAATVHTPYPLASVTKPLVATALMVLVERGRVDLAAPASRYLGPWKDGSPAGTYAVRHLLNHTSGLGTYASITWGDEARESRDPGSTFRRYGFTAHAPGVVSEYSNLGYGLIGHIVTEVSGLGLATFMEREVFRPLGMANTFMQESAAVTPSAATKYGVAGNRLPETYNDTPGAGNIYASVHDLVRFGMFHLAEDERGPASVLSAESRRLMRDHVEPGTRYPYYDSSPYGFGWYFRPRSAVAPTVAWHEGGMPGASAILILLPERGIVAAVLINANDRNDLAQGFANALIRSVEPGMTSLTFDATAGFERFSDQPEFRGSWDGHVEVDGEPLRCMLTFDADGKITIEFKDRSGSETLPAKSAFTGLVNDDLLVATLAGTLPARDVAQERGGYVLLRLLRRGDSLTGTMVAYASPERLRHLYPFPARFVRRRP